MSNETTTTTTTTIAQSLTLSSMVAQQATNNVSSFTNYASKKDLFAANSKFAIAHANKAILRDLAALKNCFSFSAHNSNSYLVVVMYFNATKSYAYYTVDCSTLEMKQHSSVKLAKQYVLAQLTAAAQQQPTTAAEAVSQPVAAAAQQPVAPTAKSAKK